MRTQSSLVRFIAAMRGAYALSAAHEAHRKPERRHLAALGIDPVDYDRIAR
ncbi:MAG TPA: hypothetical protein VLQ68_06925 [Rhizobiaceae bacterium]|nr:hypothetical protein [Rhizobiaceae bacterium]